MAQVTAVIKHSALHFCGDTDTLHLAVMTQTPVVTWFWPNPSMVEWVPKTKICRVLIGTNSTGEKFLRGVFNEELVETAKSILSAL